MLAVHPAFAEEIASKTSIEPAATRIEVDEKAGIIRFYVNGNQAAQLDELGLHLVQSVEYGKQLTDTGPSHIKAYMEAGRDETK